MSEFAFTKEEQDYARRLAGAQYNARALLAFYAAVLAPVTAFAIYGLVMRDAIAEFIAFAGVFFFTAWRIAQEVDRIAMYQSMMRKISEHEPVKRELD